MGYSERVCQICGVSFNIGRIRTRDEPEDAGWASYGSDYVVDDNPTDPCKADGCENVDRGGEEKEHIAGPACTCTQSYSGWQISIDEIRDITACVCLAVKTAGWQAEPEDEDFERDALCCFLTGVSRNGVYEFNVEGIEPPKHGIRNTMIENYFFDADRKTRDDLDEEDGAMPMHPKCFEVFKRASLRKFGKVDIDGLFLLKDNEPDDAFTRFRNFPFSDDLNIVLEQWYYHEPGTEYLAANPVEIPGLSDIFDDGKGWRDELVFDESTASSPADDPFAALSAELRLALLNLLDTRDVANLRLSSRPFRQLPQSYFRRLVLDEMPWVWEVSSLADPARDTDWHQLWLRLCGADGGVCKDEEERSWLRDVRARALQRVQDELKAKGWDWGNPEFHEKVQAEAPDYDDQAREEIREAYASGRWPGKKATELKGLRNRRRVWRDVEEILRRIEIKNQRGHRDRLGSPEE